MVDETGAQREAPLERRVGKVHPATLDDAPEDGRVEAVGIAMPLAGPAAEAHGAEADGREQLQLPGA